MSDSSLDLSELAKAAKKKLQALSNRLFEELAMDVYDEVDRRENETIWLSTQNHGSMLVSDRQTVPFLPANPEYSATRNQGRQKLAKFNKREFATLIIDILNDAKRRYAGTLSPTGNLLKPARDKRGSDREVKLSAGSQRSGSVGGGLSDDEPLYDSVCSDEDYASIGDSQSVNDESSNNSKPPKITSKENIESTSSVPVAPCSIPITVDEYQELKRTLEESQIRMQQLMNSNTTLADEVASLQNMVKKLVHENQLLRRGYSPVDVLTTVNGGSAGDSISSTRDNVAGVSRPSRWSMVESTDSRKRLQGTLTGTVREFPSPPEELLNDAKTPDAGLNDNAANTTTPRSAAGSTEVTPTDSCNPSKELTGTSLTAVTVTGGVSSLPTQEEVVRKTEKITRKLQELFHLAQEGKHESYLSCADQVHVAVTEMLSLFPQSALTSQMNDVLHLLLTGTEHLRDQCLIMQDGGAGTGGGVADYRLHTQQVIKAAYDIAKCAKQLVMLFE